MALSTTIAPMLNKKWVNFGLLTPEISCLLFTCPMSTVYVLCMLPGNAFDFRPYDFANGGISAH